MSKKETRRNGPQPPPHHIRYVLKEKTGEIMTRGTMTQVWSTNTNEWIIKKPRILSLKDTPINNLNHNNNPLLTFSQDKPVERDGG